MPITEGRRKDGNMTKTICQQCGSSMTKGARFCTSCGEATIATETADLSAPETRPFTREMAEQKIPRHSAITEELQLPQTSAQTSPSDYNTEEMPQTRTTARVEEKSTIAF